jgi:hypothetical protein
MNETSCRPRPGDEVKKESHGCALIKNNFLASYIFMVCGVLSFKHTVYPKRAANSLSKLAAFAGFAGERRGRYRVWMQEKNSMRRHAQGGSAHERRACWKGVGRRQLPLRFFCYKAGDEAGTDRL